MTLWELLLLIGFALPMIAAIQTASQAKLGWTGRMSMLLAGLVLGIVSAGMMWRLGAFSAKRIERVQERWQNRLFFVQYAAALVWLLLTASWMLAVMPRLAQVCGEVMR